MKIDDITDICAMRIITYFSDDVDKIADLIRSLFQIDEVNSIDKREVDDPTKFGYVSLHYIISLKEDRTSLVEAERFKNLKIEIQIRTILQHAWAEIEHDLGYKTIGDIPANVRRRFSRLAGQIELADEEFVRIKESVKEYSENITKKLEVNGDDVLIDIVSVRVFIQNDVDYNSLLDSISEEYEFKVNRNTDNEKLNKYLSNIVTMCGNLKIERIFELKELVTKYSEFLFEAYLYDEAIISMIESTPLSEIISTLNMAGKLEMTGKEFQENTINRWESYFDESINE